MATHNGLGGVVADTRDFGPKRFIYRPGGGREANYYAGFNTLFSEMDAYSGSKVLVFDDSLVSPCLIPSGTRDFTGIPWEGSLPHSGLTQNIVSFASGAICTGVHQLTGLVLVQTVASSGVSIRYTSGSNELLILYSTLILLSGVGLDPVIGVSGTTDLTISCYAESGLFGFGGGGDPTLNLLDATASARLKLQSGSVFIGVDVSGPVGSVLTIDNGGTTAVSLVAPTSFLGTYTVNNLLRAERVDVNSGGMSVVTASEVQGAIEELDTAIGAVSLGIVAPATFVFRPGGVASGNVYTTWAALYADLSITPGSKEVVLDDTFTTPVVIPAGSYDLDQVHLWDGGIVSVQILGPPLNGSIRQTELTFASGVTITNLTKISNLFCRGVASLGPFIIWNASSTIPSVELINCTFFTGITGPLVGPIMRVAGGIEFTMRLTTTRFPSNGVVLEVGGSSTVIFFLREDSFIGIDTLEGIAGNIINTPVLRGANCFYEPTQTGFLGTLPASLFHGAEAISVAYEPAVSGDWTGAEPTTVQEALDRIAAALGPIA